MAMVEPWRTVIISTQPWLRFQQNLNDSTSKMDPVFYNSPGGLPTANLSGWTPLQTGFQRAAVSTPDLGGQLAAWGESRSTHGFQWVHYFHTKPISHDTFKCLIDESLISKKWTRPSQDISSMCKTISQLTDQHQIEAYPIYPWCCLGMGLRLAVLKISALPLRSAREQAWAPQNSRKLQINSWKNVVWCYLLTLW